MLDTSWIEPVEAGVNELVWETSLLDAFSRLQPSSFTPGIYGSGEAARSIVEIIRNA